MPERGYQLLCPPGQRHWTIGYTVQFYEFIRLNIWKICPEIPEDFEFDLIAGGSPHSPGLVPFLGMFIPNEDYPEGLVGNIDNAIGEWLEAIPLDELAERIASTDAPTYDELCQFKVHPKRPIAG